MATGSSSTCWWGPSSATPAPTSAGAPSARGAWRRRSRPTRRSRGWPSGSRSASRRCGWPGSTRTGSAAGTRWCWGPRWPRRPRWATSSSPISSATLGRRTPGACSAPTAARSTASTPRCSPWWPASTSGTPSCSSPGPPTRRLTRCTDGRRRWSGRRRPFLSSVRRARGAVPSGEDAWMRVRNHALDGLRGLAALGVLTLHVWMFTVQGAHRREELVSLFTGELRLGVVLFFVLSGYLLAGPWVASALEDRPTPRLRRFAVKRAARIVPGYWVAMLGSFWLLSGSGHDYEVSAGQLPLFAAFGQNYVASAAGRLDPPMWSLV